MNRAMTIASKKTVFPWTALFGGLLAFGASDTLAQATPEEDITELEPMVVRGDLLLTPADELATSSTLLGEDELQRQASFHFEDVLGRVPNLTFAGGTARPRFFQIRGIGENSQFGNEIPATSVGFLVDGIDFTGMASAVSLYDAGHVEVLRGPQAAAFGANAMAGLVVVQSRAPTPYPTASAEVSFGENNFHRFAIAAGGPVGDRGSPLQIRFSGERLRYDGWIRNTFLGRDDTNERDETTARLKIRWKATPRLTLDATAVVADFNNGYDVWSLEATPFATTTDEPGRDEQRTRAVSLRADLELTEDIDLLYLGSYSDSDLLYSFDWDWSNPAKMREKFGPVIYGGTERTEHQRGRVSHDLRIRSIRSEEENGIGSWATGFYYQDFEEDQEYTVDVSDFGNFSDTSVVHSTYATEALAVYGQASYHIGPQLTFDAAARLERASIDYRLAGDSGAGEEEETLYGGNVSLTWEPLPDQRFYASIDRGYKMGGVNLDEEVPAFARVYDTETLWSYELGWKAWWPEARLQSNLTLFHMDRQDIQLDSSVQVGDGSTFALYKDNAASGTNLGAEWELSWFFHDNYELYGSLGLLEAEFDEYRYTDPENPVEERVFDGRDQTYAPAFTYRAGFAAEWDNGLFMDLSVHGRDHYVFDLESGSTLDGFAVADLSAGYRNGHWELVLWVKNVFDERYARRGFYFANEPPNYDNPRKWLSFAAPRQAGATLRWSF